MTAPLTTTATVMLPVRPPMPTPADDLRALKQSARWLILNEDFEDLLIEWMTPRVGAERMKAWGPPDTSSNVLADLCRQFATPGLYGLRPSVFHADVTNQGLVGPGGAMDLGGYWTLMQWVQYLTIGMGDWLVRVDADDTGLSYRPVGPQNVWVHTDTDHPDRPIVLWELRLRHVKLPTEEVGRTVYAWDQYDLGAVDPVTKVTIREPSYRVVQADGDKMDLSSIFIPGAPEGGLVGAAYPYRDEAGKAFLPFVIYRAVDSKQTWNHLHKVGATRGTLNAATHWTYAGHCARDASGTAVIAWGLEPIISGVQGAGEPGVIRTIPLTPGAILYHNITLGAQPSVQEVGPGGNLTEVSAFAFSYEAKQLARWGISSDDVQKSSADPASGAAMFISRQGKREYAAQVKPLFERSDLDAIRISAAMSRLAGSEAHAETGYSLSYSEIPKSPEEEKAERDELDWDLAHGHVSELDAYMRRHPGTREEDAIAALTKASVDKAKLEKARADALEEAGLAPVVDVADEGGPSVTLAPTDVARIVTVNEARASVGLPAMDGDDGGLTIEQYTAKYANTAAKAANAAAGQPTTAPATTPPAP
jgi:hypothetical protein